MLAYGLLVTVVGMSGVFAFLFLLTGCVRLMSYCVGKTQSSEELEKIAALIAIAQGGK